MSISPSTTASVPYDTCVMWCNLMQRTVDAPLLLPLIIGAEVGSLTCSW